MRVKIVYAWNCKHWTYIDMAVFDAESDHYTGLYAGLINAYPYATEVADVKVIMWDKYYPFYVMLTECIRAFEIDPHSLSWFARDTKIAWSYLWL